MLERKQLEEDLLNGGIKHIEEKYNLSRYVLNKILPKMKVQSPFCACGCGKRTIRYNEFINGHNHPAKGQKQTEETKKKISKKAKERFKNGQKINCKIYDIPTREDLDFLYNEMGYSVNKLTKILSASNPTIKKWLVSYGFEIRTQAQSLKLEIEKKRFITSYQKPEFQKKCFANRINCRRSKKEIEIEEWVRSFYEGVVIPSYKIDNRFEIDIYLPEKRIGLEYNGLYFHSEMPIYVAKEKEFHRSIPETIVMHSSKTNFCNTQGIHLIHIFEDDWNNKEKILKRKIKYLLGVDSSERIYARKCQIKKITSGIIKPLLEKHHIQGHVNASEYYGLFFNNELVAGASFTKRNNSYELVRYCTSCSVIGGFSKLIKHFCKNHNFEELYSFADLSIVNRNKNVYEANGWIESKYLERDYKYLCDGRRQHKFLFRHASLKSKLENYDPNLTEYENCINHGLFRIWDAGKIKYVYQQD